MKKSRYTDSQVLSILKQNETGSTLIVGPFLCFHYLLYLSVLSSAG